MCVSVWVYKCMRLCMGEYVQACTNVFASVSVWVCARVCKHACEGVCCCVHVCGQFMHMMCEVLNTGPRTLFSALLPQIGALSERGTLPFSQDHCQWALGIPLSLDPQCWGYRQLCPALLSGYCRFELRSVCLQNKHSYPVSHLSSPYFKKKNLKNLILGYWDNFSGRRACHQAWQSEFNPLDLHSGRRNDSASCPLASLCIVQALLTHCSIAIVCDHNRGSQVGKQDRNWQRMKTSVVEWARQNRLSGDGLQWDSSFYWA